MEGLLLQDFEADSVDAGETAIFIRRMGTGRPLLLLHGFPQTHLMWHRIAPELARDFTVVCADLRGYGASGKPCSTPDHAPYAKAAMARDMIGVMERLGFERFSVAGHDRGGRVAYRMALEHPQRIERVALLDIIPTGEAFARADARFALGFWPWSLLAQPEPLPERLILADPAASSSFCRRPVMNTVAPSFTKRFAVARPSPLEPPVMRATFRPSLFDTVDLQLGTARSMTSRSWICHASRAKPRHRPRRQTRHQHVGGERMALRPTGLEW